MFDMDEQKISELSIDPLSPQSIEASLSRKMEKRDRGCCFTFLKDKECHGDNVIIYYSSDTDRIIETLQIFKNTLGIQGNRCIDHNALRTTKKIENN